MVAQLIDPARAQWLADYRRVRTVMTGTSFQTNNTLHHDAVWHEVFDALYHRAFEISSGAARCHFDYQGTPASWYKPNERWKMSHNMRLSAEACEFHRRNPPALKG